MSQIEYDISEYILQHPELSIDCKDTVNQLSLNSNTIVFREFFNEAYQGQLLYLIRKEISYIFNLNYEEVNVIITKELIEKLLGEEYFIYEHKN